MWENFKRFIVCISGKWKQEIFHIYIITSWIYCWKVWWINIRIISKYIQWNVDYYVCVSITDFSNNRFERTKFGKTSENVKSRCLLRENVWVFSEIVKFFNSKQIFLLYLFISFVRTSCNNFNLRFRFNSSLSNRKFSNFIFLIWNLIIISLRQWKTLYKTIQNYRKNNIWNRYTYLIVRWKIIKYEMLRFWIVFLPNQSQ